MTRAPRQGAKRAPAKLPAGIAVGPDGRPRCRWGVSTADYVAYHDTEWGFPVHDDRRLFEKLCLEGFQSGLSWLTILRKRDAFRAGFASFEIAKVARFTARDVTRLLGDAGIVRHRGKIESTINNARRALELVDEHGSLASYAWSFVPPRAERPKVMSHAALAALGSTPTSTRLSKDLKRRGWTFVGPTTVYAFMQAMGLVNDHLEGCVIHPAGRGRSRGRARAHLAIAQREHVGRQRLRTLEPDNALASSRRRTALRRSGQVFQGVIDGVPRARGSGVFAA